MPTLSNATNMDISKSLEAANTTYSALYEQLFQAEPTAVSNFYAKKVPTDGATLRLDMLGPPPVMQKWVGPRIEKFLRAYNYTISLDTYEATLWLSRKDIQYDKTGMIGRRMADFFKAMPNVYDKHAMAMLLSNKKGYDGVSLLSASHPHAKDAGTWSNYDTNALNVINVRTAEQNALAVTLENGEPADISFTHAIVGPKNKDTARRIWQADERVGAFDGRGQETDFGGNPRAVANIYRGELDVVVDKRITGSTYQYYWFLVDASKPYGAIIIMEGQPPQPTVRDKPDDERVWSSDQIGYGLVGDVSFAPGAPQTISGHFATAGGW